MCRCQAGAPQLATQVPGDTHVGSPPSTRVLSVCQGHMLSVSRPPSQSHRLPRQSPHRASCPQYAETRTEVPGETRPLFSGCCFPVPLEPPCIQQALHRCFFTELLVAQAGHQSPSPVLRGGTQSRCASQSRLGMGQWQAQWPQLLWSTSAHSTLGLELFSSKARTCTSRVSSVIQPPQSRVWGAHLNEFTLR